MRVMSGRRSVIVSISSSTSDCAPDETLMKATVGCGVTDEPVERRLVDEAAREEGVERRFEYTGHLQVDSLTCAVRDSDRRADCGFGALGFDDERPAPSAEVVDRAGHELEVGGLGHRCEVAGGQRRRGGVAVTDLER